MASTVGPEGPLKGDGPVHRQRRGKNNPAIPLGDYPRTSGTSRRVQEEEPGPEQKRQNDHTVE